MKVRFIAGGLAAVTAVTAAAPLSVYASSNYSMRKKVIVTAGIVESGILGIIVGCAVTKTAGKLMGIGAYPTFGSILISFGVSVGIGLSFGYMPASRAASMSSIDALRSE